jgi:flagellin-like protein
MKRFRRNRKGISTIIAAALIVAMTVIAAIALGSTVLQVSTSQQKPYHLQMTGTASVSANEILLTHIGGDPINTGTVTFKTLIPDGKYQDVEYTIPNVDTSGWPNIGFRLQSDTLDYINKPAYYTYLEMDSAGAHYNAPVQAGDTLVLNFEKSFATGVYGSYIPDVGTQFIVELYSGTQPVTSVTIVVQP